LIPGQPAGPGKRFAEEAVDGRILFRDERVEEGPGDPFIDLQVEHRDQGVDQRFDGLRRVPRSQQAQTQPPGCILRGFLSLFRRTAP
jgi:hypothetical protein